ncbi:MAG: hypothetical protein KA712_13800 [Myxococcales bacterium]|nr:hypothetical protein [Myxococcales bacterium]
MPLRLAHVRRLATLAVLAASAGCIEQPLASNDAGLEADTAPKRDAAPPPPVTLVPTTRAALATFLEEGQYRAFAAESRVHASEGPHGLVLTFMNPILFDSLAAGNRTHPRGAAAVKEIYKGGQTLAGWSVMVKVASESLGGDGYFWFEAVEGRLTAEGTGDPLCAQCHQVGNDFILSRFPLR